MTGRYQNAKVYKLVNDVDDEIYVGSTCLSLARRKSVHKCRAKTNVRQRIYAHLNAVGWDHVRIVLIEDYPCNTKRDMVKREQFYIDQLNPSLNKNAAYVGEQNICPHDLVVDFCRDCAGRCICVHGKQKTHCNDCSPYVCDYCQQSYSKATILRHYKSTKHRRAYTAAYFECWSELPTKFPFNDLVH